MGDAYTALEPIFAASRMHVGRNGHFTQIMTYDYRDKGQKTKFGSDYWAFLENPLNMQNELTIYQENLQGFLDAEKNYINGHAITQKIQHCSIQFRTRKDVSVQWIIEFGHPFKDGLNIYENMIEVETLEYPIYSIYILEEGLRIAEIRSKLSYTIEESRRIIEFRGKTGEQIGPQEMMHFQR
jgi:hypothetical protein